jgi:septal ring factor EnvC (AmiA/AmiB activator)
MLRNALTVSGVLLALLACDGFSTDSRSGDSSSLRGGRTESQWRAAAVAHQRQIEALERQVEQTREEIWALPASFDSRIVAREERLERRIEDFEQQIAQAEDRLEALEDQARRAGVPPGWLRD